MIVWAAATRAGHEGWARKALNSSCGIITTSRNTVSTTASRLRWRAAAMARWRTASGLRAGMPRPWRVKALRSDGQVVPSSVAAALTLPSCSARVKAR